MGFIAVFADCPHNGVLEPYLYQLTANMHKTTLKKKTRILVVDGLNIA